MKLSELTVFAVGYVVGAKAGRERYAQILEGLARASKSLEEFSERRPPRGAQLGSARADGRPRSSSSPN